jgi:glycogen(starch) synthase
MFWPLIGGIEIYAKQFIPEIQKYGHDVTIITVRRQEHPEQEVIDGATVYRLPVYEALLGRDVEAYVELLKRVAAIKRQTAPDLVHANLFGPSIVMHLETGKAAPVPTLVALHSDLKRIGKLGNTLQRALDQAAWVTAVSAATLRDSRTMFPQIRDKSSVVYNGIAADGIEPRPLPKGPPRVLCIGRLVSFKGFDVALDAFALARPSISSAHLTIAGDGPERDALQRRARHLGLGDSVTFTGWVGRDDLYDLIGRSSVVLMPSRFREPFGMVAVEAALVGRPIIASRVGGLPEVVIDGETGILVDRDDPPELARRLVEIVSDPALASRIGERARAVTLQRFSIAANAAAYDVLYRKLLAKNAS